MPVYFTKFENKDIRMGARNSHDIKFAVLYRDLDTVIPVGLALNDRGVEMIKKKFLKNNPQKDSKNIVVTLVNSNKVENNATKD